MNIDTADLLELTTVRAGSGNKLSNNGHLLGSVDGLAPSVEGPVSQAERVEIASVLVANTLIAIISDITALSALATAAIIRQSMSMKMRIGGFVWDILLAAGVRSEGGSHGVGLPNIHLVTAGSVAASTSVLIIRVWLPVQGVGL